MPTVNLTRDQCELLADLLSRPEMTNVAAITSKGGYGNIVVERWGELGCDYCEYNEKGEWLRDVHPPRVKS